MDDKKLTNYKRKLNFLRTRGRTKTTIFCIIAAVLIAKIGISAVSSATLAEAAREGPISSEVYGV
jgi:hypothetical protein